MIAQRPPEPSPGFADKAADAADNAIRATQRLTQDALDGMAGSVQGVRDDAAPLIDRAGRQASDLAHRGASALRQTTQSLRESTGQATERAALYVREEPLKAMLIAAATGAALMALVGLLSRSRGRD